MQTFVVKAASGIAVFLTGIGLDLIGLVGNTDETGPIAVQSASTILGLRLLMTILPIIGLLTALVFFQRKFLLTDQKVEEMAHTLQEKRNAT
jgi:melibiose permease